MWALAIKGERADTHAHTTLTPLPFHSLSHFHPPLTYPLSLSLSPASSFSGIVDQTGQPSHPDRGQVQVQHGPARLSTLQRAQPGVGVAHQERHASGCRDLRVPGVYEADSELRGEHARRR